MKVNSVTTYRKKLIEVALPLEAINTASAREKSIRHGHPSTLHLWWARRPLAACRAMLLALLWPDPCDKDCPEDFKEEARKLLPKVQGSVGPNDQDLRQALLKFIGDFANWDLATNRSYRVRILNEIEPENRPSNIFLITGWVLVAASRSLKWRSKTM